MPAKLIAERSRRVPIERSQEMRRVRRELVAGFGHEGMNEGAAMLRANKEMQRLGYYPTEDLQQIVTRSASILSVGIEADGGLEIAKRSRGTPRVANRLLRRVRDYAQVRADGTVTREVAQVALGRLNVDEYGLDDMDARILKIIIEKFDGGPVGLNTMAVAVGEDAETLEEVYEPFLIQRGFLDRTPRGRAATPAAYRHFGFTPPRTSAGDQKL